MIKLKADEGQIEMEISGAASDLLSEGVCCMIKLAQAMSQGNKEEFEVYMSTIACFLNDEEQVNEIFEELEKAKEEE